MAFFISMFVCNLIVPIVMLIAGFCLYKNPSQEISNYSGYRTKRSKLSKDTWIFAQRMYGKIWSVAGIILLAATVLVQLPFAKSGENTIVILTLIILTVQVGLIILSMLPVEKALKENFDENGIRRVYEEKK